MDYMGQKGGIKRMIYLKHLVFILLVMVVLTGCSLINKDEDEKEEYQSPMEYSTEQSEYIMECIVNKDKEGLKSVFSKQVSKTHDLDKEIDEFFQFIDGEIVSYDEPEGSMGGGRKKDGEYVERTTGGQIENIKTDEGKTYEISFFTYWVCRDSEDREGVDSILIIEVPAGGEIVNSKYRIGND